MQNTSAAFKTAIASTKRTLATKAVLQTADATIYNLGPGDIIAGSLSVNSSCFDDGIELGSTVAADCSIALNNADGAWNNIDLDGATIWPYSGIVLPDTTTEYVKLGTFIIDDPGRPYSQITLQASDRMILLDEPFSAVTKTFPATNLQILQVISSHCNVPLASSITGILNVAYSVTARPADDLTCRDVVGMIALMAAGFARTNRDGELEIIQLPNLSGTIAVEMPVGSRFEGFMQTSDAVTVTGLTYTDIDETVQLGTDVYSLQVDQIPLLQANRDTVLASIWAAISGYTYTGYTCPYPGNPAIDPGDSVRHVTMDGKTNISLVSSHNFVHGGQSTLEATAKSQATMSYKGANARRLSTIAAKVQGVDAKLTTFQQTQAQFTDLLTQAMGYFVTEELQEDGSTIHYEHDHPLLADSVVIYKKTATTMSWTPDAGAHWYGMSAEGNILARVLTAIGINADWVIAGILQSLDGRSFFNLTTGEIKTQSLIQWYLNNSGLTPVYETLISRLYQGGLFSRSSMPAINPSALRGGKVSTVLLREDSNNNGSSFAKKLALECTYLWEQGSSPYRYMTSIDLSNTGVEADVAGGSAAAGSNTVPLKVWMQAFFMQEVVLEGGGAVGKPTYDSDIANRQYVHEPDNDAIAVKQNWGGAKDLATTTGYIRIYCGTESYMFDAHITIRSYNYLVELDVGGFTYTTTAAWHYPQVVGKVRSRATEAPIELAIRFVSVGTARYILIGESTTIWGNYPGVSVDKLNVVHYSMTQRWSIDSSIYVPAGGTVDSIQYLYSDDNAHTTRGYGLWQTTQIVALAAKAQNVAQLIAIAVPAGVFVAKPTSAILQAASTAGLVIGYNYDGSSATSLQFWILKCDGALGAGNYRFSLMAGLY